VTDLTPLARLAGLELLVLTETAADPTLLAHLPRLAIARD
jgi:hypothetical protein